VETTKPPQTPVRLPGSSGDGGNGEPPVRAAMRIYKAEPPKKTKRRRRWLKITIWVVVILLVLVAAAAGAFYLYVRDAYQTIVSANNPIDKSAPQHLLVALPSKPTTFLIIGADARPGDKYGRSDTLMLVRVDPNKKFLTLLSMPRDWLIALPGYSRQPITNYFSLGGPALAIDAVAYATGIRPNYYVRVDFNGFTRTVNALGGVYVEVERRYYHQNPGNAAGSLDDYMTINLPPGYEKLSGLAALAFVRYRHTDSDIYRLARQQRFMRAMKKKIDPSTIGSNLLTFISIAKDDLKIIGRKPMSESTMLSYGELMKQIDLNNIISIRLQGYADPVQAGRIDVSQQEVDAARAAFSSPDPTQARRAADQTTGVKQAKTAGVNMAAVPVEVRNGNGQLGAAANAAHQLAQAGWTKAASHGDADSAKYFDTIIYYKQGDATAQAAAKKMTTMVQPSTMAPLTSKVIGNLDGTQWPVLPSSKVVVVIGSTFDQVVKPAEAPLQPRAAAEVKSDPTRDLADWRSAQHHTKLKLMYPTVLPLNSITGDPDFPAYPHFRIYSLPGGPAINVTYYLANLGGPGAFDIQAMKWSNPPILDSPNQTTTVNGITYRLYLNGANIDRIAWNTNGTTMWVSNTLGEALTNRTMWAIARGIQPVK
jgi:LCP family protein required for cell wall assembly